MQRLGLVWTATAITSPGTLFRHGYARNAENRSLNRGKSTLSRTVSGNLTGEAQRLARRVLHRSPNPISLQTNMIKELDLVALRKSVPEQRLKAADVVLVHEKSEGFEVEFLILNAETVGVATLTAAQVRPVLKRKITHARVMRA